MTRNRLSNLVVASLFLLPGVSTAWADIPPRPPVLPPGKQAHPISVQTDINSEFSVLRIPRAFLPQGKGPQANVPLLERFDATRSIVAALALSLGVVGMLFLRKRRIGGVAALVVATSVLTGVTVELWANAPAPPPMVLNTPFQGDVIVEVVEQGPVVSLVIGTKAKSRGNRFQPPPTSNAPNALGAPSKSLP